MFSSYRFQVLQTTKKKFQKCYARERMKSVLHILYCSNRPLADWYDVSEFDSWDTCFRGLWFSYRYIRIIVWPTQFVSYSLQWLFGWLWLYSEKRMYSIAGDANPVDSSGLVTFIISFDSFRFLYLYLYIPNGFSIFLL